MSPKKLFLTIFSAFLLAVLTITNLASAANLSQAAASLPSNEEWAIMAKASVGTNTGSGHLATALNSTTATDYEKRILAITAIGENPRTISSENFLAKLESMFDGNQIGASTLLNDDIFGILALHSAGGSTNIISKSRQYLLSNQNSDGGWGFGVNVSSDSNTTAAAITALAVSGSVPGSAINFLNQAKHSSGGFGYTAGQAPDGASTAWAIWGLRAASQNIPANTTSFLEGLQLPGGTFKWRSSDNQGSTLVTAYAVIALSGKTLPIRTNSSSYPTPYTTPYATPFPLPPARSNNSACISITAPDSVPAGASFSATVNMRNTGSTAWTRGNLYRLGSQNPQDNTRWNTGRVDLSQSQINNNEIAAFSWNPTAPQVTGTYSFSWRVLQENVEWFGDTCTKNITVTAALYPTPYSTPYQTPNYPTPYTTPYSTPYTTPYQTPYATPYSTPYVTPYQTPAYPTPYNTPYQTPYATPYVTPYTTPYQTPTYPTPYQTPNTPTTYNLTVSFPGNKIFADSAVFNGNQTALEVLIATMLQINMLYEVQVTALGKFVKSINGYSASGISGWQYAVNGTVPAVGADQYRLQPGDRLQWFYGATNSNPF